MTSLQPGDKQKTMEKEDRESEQDTNEHLRATLGNLQKQNEMLRREVLKSKHAPSMKIGFILLAIGTVSLLGSVVNNQAALALIGLGLTFWGALFLFARPVKFVRGVLLGPTVISSYKTMDRIIEDLNYHGKPIYVPPYPKQAYLPDYLKGLKEIVVFIPAEDATAMPTIEEMVKKRFMLKNPRGICITPPGYGLVNLFEKELRAEFPRIEMERLFNNLSTIIVKNLELAKEVEISPENDFIHARIVDSVFMDLFMNEQGLKNIHSLGCPLASAIACSLAEATGKFVSIVKDVISSDFRTVEVWYKTLEA